MIGKRGGAKSRACALAVTTMFLHSPATATDSPECAARPDVVASCFAVRGRLSFWNGAPSARIWHIGSTRMLGVHNDEVPVALASQMAGFDTEAWGNFAVCPLTQRIPGHMQMVCIESWSELRFRERVSRPPVAAH